jgi:ParB/RepB/Spo0J family partition protein
MSQLQTNDVTNENPDVQAIAAGLKLPGGQREAEERVIEVDPDIIIINPIIHAMRDWTGSSKQEMTINALADAIFEEGQLQAGVIRETEEGLELVFGERRLKAVQKLRAAGENIYYRCVVRDLTNDQAFRLACLENEQRETLTEMEKARQVGTIREHFKWQGAGGRDKIAQLLGVSPATITQREKLMRADVENIQKPVAEGKMGKTAALEILTSPEEQQVPVAKLAKRIAAEREEKEGKEKAEKKKLVKTTEFVSAAVTGKKKDKEKREMEKAAPFVAGVEADVAEKVVRSPAEPSITYRDVRKAQQQIPGAIVNPKAPKMAEAVELFEQFDGPAFQPVMRTLAQVFCNWAGGKIGDQILKDAWSRVDDALFAALHPHAMDGLEEEEVDGAKEGIKDYEDGDGNEQPIPLEKTTEEELIPEEIVLVGPEFEDATQLTTFTGEALNLSTETVETESVTLDLPVKTKKAVKAVTVVAAPTKKTSKETAKAKPVAAAKVKAVAKPVSKPVAKAVTATKPSVKVVAPKSKKDSKDAKDSKNK